MEGLNNSSAPNLILVKTALDKLLAEEQLKISRTGKAEATDPIVFTQDTATNAAVVSSVIGGGGYFSKNTDDVSIKKNAAIQAPAPKTTLIAEFSKDLPISRNFMADQQQSAVSKAVAKQTKTWNASRDRNAFGVYANGFSTQTTIDGVALFSNSHTNQNSDTVDNLETGVLNDTNLNVVVNSLRTQTSQDGVTEGYEPDFMLTPSILHQTGMSVAKSVLRAGTGNNDLNYWSEMYPGMKVVYSPFLDTASTTAYFVGSSGHGVTRFEREAFHTDITDWKVSAAANQGDFYKYLMRAREEVDAIEYSGLVGSNGTV